MMSTREKGGDAPQYITVPHILPLIASEFLQIGFVSAYTCHAPQVLPFFVSRATFGLFWDA